MLEAVTDKIAQVSADGAYDTFNCYDAIKQRQAQAAIPPRHDAQPLEPDATAPSHPRDQTLQRIEQVGRKAWKQESGYHRRSLAETTMFRLKTIKLLNSSSNERH